MKAWVDVAGLAAGRLGPEVGLRSAGRLLDLASAQADPVLLGSILQVLAVVNTRLPPAEAGAIAERELVRMTGSRDLSVSVPAAKALVAALERLGANDAPVAARRLIAALAQTKDELTSVVLAGALPPLLARMTPTEASDLCAASAADFHAASTLSDAIVFTHLMNAVDEVAKRASKEDARRIWDAVTARWLDGLLKAPTEADAVAFASKVSGVRDRFSPSGAQSACARVLDAMQQSKEAPRLAALAEVARELATGLERDEKEVLTAVDANLHRALKGGVNPQSQAQLTRSLVISPLLEPDDRVKLARSLVKTGGPTSAEDGHARAEVAARLLLYVATEGEQPGVRNQLADLAEELTTPLDPRDIAYVVTKAIEASGKAENDPPRLGRLARTVAKFAPRLDSAGAAAVLQKVIAAPSSPGVRSAPSRIFAEQLFLREFDRALESVCWRLRHSDAAALLGTPRLSERWRARLHQIAYPDPPAPTRPRW
jgi:hypothetical protein